MTTLPSLFFDRYSLTARYYPGLLALFPTLLTIIVLYPTSYEHVSKLFISLAIVCGFPVFITNIIRSLGRKKEVTLYKLWGGAPSTRWLRHSDHNIDSITKARYHNFLTTHVPNLVLPSQNEEINDPINADNCYNSAIKWLLEYTRDKKQFPLVFKENIIYGFRRNMLAVKLYALLITALCLKTLLHSITFEQIIQCTYSSNIALAAALLITAILWLFVSPRWVEDASYSYARALLASCDKEKN